MSDEPGFRRETLGTVEARHTEDASVLPAIRNEIEAWIRVPMDSTTQTLMRERAEAERDRLRAALERIEAMAVRPLCMCGRSTGTLALQIVAAHALDALRALSNPTATTEEP